MRSGFVVFIALFQTILLSAHVLVYETALYFARPVSAVPGWWLVAVVALAASFTAASLLTFRYWNTFTRVFYRMAAVWLGVFNFLFVAAVGAWTTLCSERLAGQHWSHRAIGAAWLGLALVAALWGLVNASVTRVRRVRVQLPNLPAAWRGRKAAMISDLHLGHVRGANFARNIVSQVRQLRPEIVFLAGDLYDGGHADLDELAGPLRSLNAPLGNYFVAGNHEEIRNAAAHLAAAQNAGLRLLNNEKVIVDGMQIIGVHHRDAARPERLNAVLEHAAIDRGKPSVLVVHAPDQLAVAERAGISLQLSGHTHRGQFFPWTWFTRRIYKQFVYGLQRFGDMLVYTSSGAGTWGPPLRVCSQPEIVLIQFE
ncbi:MAG TPA: metallophosphoesterase [Dongiaceae bacterium]|nr:metallophosphoesterase [Dongiaceae bacterium]